MRRLSISFNENMLAGHETPSMYSEVQAPVDAEPAGVVYVRKQWRRLRQMHSMHGSNIDSILSPPTHEEMLDLVKKKSLKPHYSQIHPGKFELLSVDDDSTTQMIIEGLLRPLGYILVPALDGAEALEIMKSRSYLPDLVLLDVEMPGVNGYQVCRQMRNLYSDGLPIIMLSANVDEASILKGLEVGSNDYIKKPYSRAELVARIETQLRLRDGWIAEIEAIRSNNVLDQVFPEHVAERLKNCESVIAESHERVTILFSDIVGFTHMSTTSDTSEVFKMLNRLYTAFDALVDKHGVHKVDTIGDAYMVAAGHEERSREDHAHRMLTMAEDMLRVAETVQTPDGSRVRIRVGVHTGPAFAGVVGVKCPKYTFIGDTVNTASRMESNGFPGCIHVSSATRDLVGDAVDWADFGHRDIKGKGYMNTYLAKVGDWEAALLSRLAAPDALDLAAAAPNGAAAAAAAANDHDGPMAVVTTAGRAMGARGAGARRRDGPAPAPWAQRAAVVVAAVAARRGSISMTNLVAAAPAARSAAATTTTTEAPPQAAAARRASAPFCDAAAATAAAAAATAAAAAAAAALRAGRRQSSSFSPASTTGLLLQSDNDCGAGGPRPASGSFGTAAIAGVGGGNMSPFAAATRDTGLGGGSFVGPPAGPSGRRRSLEGCSLVACGRDGPAEGDDETAGTAAAGCSRSSSGGLCGGGTRLGGGAGEEEADLAAVEARRELEERARFLRTMRVAVGDDDAAAAASGKSSAVGGAGGSTTGRLLCEALALLREYEHEGARLLLRAEGRGFAAAASQLPASAAALPPPPAVSVGAPELMSAAASSAAHAPAGLSGRPTYLEAESTTAAAVAAAAACREWWVKQEQGDGARVPKGALPPAAAALKQGVDPRARSTAAAPLPQGPPPTCSPVRAVAFAGCEPLQREAVPPATCAVCGSGRGLTVGSRPAEAVAGKAITTSQPAAVPDSDAARLMRRMCAWPPPARPSLPRGSGGRDETEVQQLLRCLGLEHYARTLDREEVGSVAALAAMTPDQLRDAGVASLGARAALLDAARGLRALAAAASAPPASTPSALAASSRHAVAPRAPLPCGPQAGVWSADRGSRLGY